MKSLRELVDLYDRSSFAETSALAAVLVLVLILAGVMISLRTSSEYVRAQKMYFSAS